MAYLTNKSLTTHPSVYVTEGDATRKQWDFLLWWPKGFLDVEAKGEDACSLSV